MALAIRNVRDDEMGAVLAINNAAGHNILAMDQAKVRYFFEYADYFRVIEIDGHLAGFLIALLDGTHYTSPNYRWFCDHYRQFLYIDRIVIANAHHGQGLGRILYCDVQSFAETHAPLLACELFLEPRDDMVILFHGSFGFQEVGQQRVTSNQRKVSLLTKQLPSYTYVHETWLMTGGLPEQSWLAGRHTLHMSSHPQRILAKQLP